MKKIMLCLMAMLIILTSTVFASKIYSVDINGVEKKVAIEYVANELIGNGFNIISVNDYSIVSRKDIDNFWAKVVYGSRFNSTPEFRMTLNFAQYNGSVKVIAETRVVTNPNSAYERSQVMENKDTQKMLDRFKASIEQKYNINQPPRNIGVVNQPFGFTYADSLAEGCILVNSVTSGSPADKAGLRFSDKITRLNGLPITTVNNFNFMVNASSTIDLSAKTGYEPERMITISKI